MFVLSPRRINPMNSKSELVQLVLSTLVFNTISEVSLYANVQICFRFGFSTCFLYSDLLIHIYLLDFRIFYWLLISHLSLLVNACNWIPKSYHLIMYACDCLCTSFGFILRTRWVAFWLPWTFMSRYRILDRAGIPLADQSSAAEAWIIGGPSGALSSRPPARF